MPASTSSSRTISANWTTSTSGLWGMGLSPRGTPPGVLQSLSPIRTLLILDPRRVCSNRVSYSYKKHEVEFQQNKAIHIAKMSRKRDPVFDTDTSISDSSAEEDVKEASGGPEPDAGYTYSFDAPCGPSKGSQILGIALTKAVDKFETKATEKLIKEEYEVVAKEKEDAHTGYAADEDDFELI